MRYTEPKDRSAELLRMALANMGRHEAAFNPVTFTLWYEYAAGINPRLHAAVDELLRAKAPIGDETVDKLFQEHVAPRDEVALRRLSGDFQRVISGIEQSASHTGDHAGRFGAQLDDLSAALQSSDFSQLSPQLDEARAGTAEMKSSAQALQRQVAEAKVEITRLRTDLDRARGEALLDPLTGVLNRKGFDQHLKALFDQAADNGQQHCLLMFDIDHFKQVNDSHGHLMGDRVLQAVGEILRKAIPGQAHAARYGGEEFAIVLPHSRLDEAFQLAEQVRLRTKAMKIRSRTTQDVLFTVTISAGVAGLQSGDDSSALIARADAALYRSKQAGRDQVNVSKP